jgi:hypothetical protein
MGGSSGGFVKFSLYKKTKIPLIFILKKLWKLEFYTKVTVSNYPFKILTFKTFFYFF